MEMIPVESSNLHAIGYDLETGSMRITFTNGRTYHYADVPQDVYQALLDASSKGAYFAEHIRPVYRGIPEG